MAFFDWDHNGKKDLIDDIIEYNVYRDVMGLDEDEKEKTYDTFHSEYGEYDNDELDDDDFDEYLDNYSYYGGYNYNSSSDSRYSEPAGYHKRISESDSVLDTGEGAAICFIISVIISALIFKMADPVDISLTLMMVVWLIISFIVAAIIDWLR